MNQLELIFEAANKYILIGKYPHVKRHYMVSRHGEQSINLYLAKFQPFRLNSVF